MIFEITRTTDWKCRKAPCDGAVMSVGSNQETIYHLNIDTLDELIELSRKEGEIIIGINVDGKYYLEIYDGYRE